ncbi:MAG: zinc ribbon domain-containing protein [Clostridiales bacterium]|nr:zinc ribbon domain-containing protein [Eubacteriales bacterium]MDH7565596.1 zinc ribbon domain-containing protein [Clostridiales bacterium]
MSILEGARNKLANSARAAVNSSREFVEISRINMDIKSEEDRIRTLMLEIGNLVYEAYKGERPIEEEINLKCEKIRDCEDRIEKLKEKIVEIKGQKQCPGCNAKVQRGYIYCPRCGSKLDM